MSYCNDMSDMVGGKLTSLTSLADTHLSGYYNQINGLIALPSISKGNLNTISNALSDLASIENEIRSYAGSCLDGIIDLVDTSIITDIFDLIPSNISLAMPDLMSLINSVVDLNGLYNSLGIGALVEKINSLLGCLSSSDCNVTNLIMNTFDSFESTYLGFTANGFDITEIGIGTPFESISKDLKNITSKVENTIKKASTIVPSAYF